MNYFQLSAFILCFFTAVHTRAESFFYNKNNHRNPLKELFRKREWEFIEDQFVLRIEKAHNSFLSSFKITTATIATTLATSALFYAATEKYVPTDAKNDFPVKAATQFFGTPLIVLLSTIGTHKLSTYLVEQSITFKALEKFVREWPENQEFTPEQFHSTFDTLHQQYHFARSEFNNNAPEIMRLLQRAIYEHFSYKYQNKLKEMDGIKISGTFFHAIVTCDLIQLVTKIGELFAYFAGTKR